jgi:hypothetical protein
LATVATACESRFFHREPNDFSHPMWHHGGVAHQSHRGPASKDEKLFGARQLPALQAATQDLCWLLDHGYASHSATELVGNRHNRTSRQRMNIRCAGAISLKSFPALSVMVTSPPRRMSSGSSTAAIFLAHAWVSFYFESTRPWVPPGLLAILLAINDCICF